MGTGEFQWYLHSRGWPTVGMNLEHVHLVDDTIYGTIVLTPYHFTQLLDIGVRIKLELHFKICCWLLIFDLVFGHSSTLRVRGVCLLPRASCYK